jgi:hypothetical protein
MPVDSAIRDGIIDNDTDEDLTTTAPGLNASDRNKGIGIQISKRTSGRTKLSINRVAPAAAAAIKTTGECLLKASVIDM